MKSDVVIVGGGIAGLTSAAFCARGGASVTLLEAGLGCGGRGRTREQNGYRFNFGPHALYLAGAAKRTLDELGVDLPGGPAPTDRGFFVHGGDLLPMPVGGEGLARCAWLTMEDKAALASSYGAIAQGKVGAVGESVTSALMGLSANEIARDIIAAQIRVSSYSNAPEEADAGASFEQLRLAAAGVRYLDNGWGAMTEALERVVRSHGVNVVTERRVERVAEGSAGWRVVCSNGQTLEAGALILAVEPAEAARQSNDPSLSKAAKAVMPVRLASLDLALARLPRDTHRFALGLDEPTYFSVHSHTARGLAPKGGALVHASWYLGADERPSTAIRGRLEALLDLMQPGWRDVLVAQQWLAQAVVTHDQPQALRGGLAGRASATQAKGLYCAGDWVGADGLLSDAAFASARVAAANALKAA